MDLELGQQIVSHGQSPKTSIQQSPLLLLLEFMNVKRSRSIFIEVAKKLSSFWPGNMFYISLYVNAELLSNMEGKLLSMENMSTRVHRSWIAGQ